MRTDKLEEIENAPPVNHMLSGPRVRSPLMLFSIEKDPGKSSIKSKVKKKVEKLKDTGESTAPLPYPSSPNSLGWVEPGCDANAN